MRRSILMTLVVAALTLSGCAEGDDGGDKTAPEQTAAAEAPSLADAAGATYAGIYENPVTLVDGLYEGEPFVEGGASRPSVMLIDDLYETGDLDGDGSPEAVVLLVESSGASGSNLFVAALSRRDGQVTNVGTSLVGDRVQIRTMSLYDKKIYLNVVQGDADDAACCPTEKATRTWTLEKTGLVEGEPSLQGPISTADLDDTEWVLTHWSHGEAASDTIPVTLHFSEGKVWGNSGCNNYFAEMSEPAPGELQIVRPGVTRKACPETVMQVEARFLKALEGATKYGFLAGKLGITCKVGDDTTTLLFVKGAQ